MTKRNLTPADVRKIAKQDGIAHAEFCVEQERTQRGEQATTKLYEELSRIENELFGVR